MAAAPKTPKVGVKGHPLRKARESSISPVNFEYQVLGENAEHTLVDMMRPSATALFLWIVILARAYAADSYRIVHIHPHDRQAFT